MYINVNVGTAEVHMRSPVPTEKYTENNLFIHFDFSTMKLVDGA